MTSANPEPDRDVFREYHRTGRSRAWRVSLGALAMVILVAGTIAGISALAVTHQNSSSATLSGSSIQLTKATFASTVQAAPSAATTAHFTLTMTANGQTITAEGEASSAQSGAGAAVAMKMVIPNVGTADARLVHRVFYVNLGKATQYKFAAIPLNDPSNPVSQISASVDKVADPRATVAQVEKSIRSVTVAGPSIALDGVDATPYDVVLDTAAVKATLGLENSQAPLPDQITYRYWVGSDKLVRKMSLNLAGTSEVVTFEKWGQPVSITAPSADQVTTLPAQH